MVVYHFQKVSGNVPLKSKLDTTSVWVVPAKTFQEQRSPLKGSRVSYTERSERKFVFHFFKAIFDTSFMPSRSFFRQMEPICTNGRFWDSVTKFTSPKFCLPFTQTVDRPAALCKW